MTARKTCPFPTADEIAERAHELFLAGGRRIAMISDYWRDAERELLQRAADRMIAAASPTPPPKRRRRGDARPPAARAE
jgi:hypothetical protein